MTRSLPTLSPASLETSGAASKADRRLRCRTCGAGFLSKLGRLPCAKPSPGREYVDTGRGNHIFEQPQPAQPAQPPRDADAAHRRSEVLASRAEVLVRRARGLYERAAEAEAVALAGVSKKTHPRTHKIIAESVRALRWKSRRGA